MAFFNTTPNQRSSNTPMARQASLHEASSDFWSVCRGKTLAGVWGPHRYLGHGDWRKGGVANAASAVRWTKRMPRSLALYPAPTAAGLATVALLLGPAQERPVIGARAHGVVARGATACAIRVQTVRHWAGLYKSVALPDVAVTLADGTRALGSWRGQTDADGVAEALFALSEPLGRRLSVRVSTEGTVLGSAKLSTETALAAQPAGAVLQGERQGRIELDVTAPRGLVVAPFEERLRVEAAVPGSSDGEPPRLRVQALGVDVPAVGEPRQGPCNDEGCACSWTVLVRPQAMEGELRLEAESSSGARGRWTGALGVQLGRLWLEPGGVSRGELRIQAPGPLGRAYVSVHGARGRLWGAVVPLRVDEAGFAAGRTKLPPLPDGPLVALLSSDPGEPGENTTSWPLRPELGTLEHRSMQTLVDGLPARIAAEKEREVRARLPVVALVLLAGLAELLLLWRHYRLARRRHRQHLQKMMAAARASGAHGGNGDSANERELDEELDDDEPLEQALSRAAPGVVSPLWSAMIALAVALGFAMLAAVAAWA